MRILADDAAVTPPEIKRLKDLHFALSEIHQKMELRLTNGKYAGGGTERAVRATLERMSAGMEQIQTILLKRGYAIHG